MKPATSQEGTSPATITSLAIQKRSASPTQASQRPRCVHDEALEIPNLPVSLTTEDLSRDQPLSIYLSPTLKLTRSLTLLQCLFAFSDQNPACIVLLDAPGVNLYSCSVFFSYSFLTDSCRSLYQSSENNSTVCPLYSQMRLGDPANRKNTTLPSPDYTC